jgi:uncharacterized membrane protein
MARLFSIRPGITFRGRKFKGLRGWAGKPLHPPLTDIPVGAYIIAAGFDVLSWAGDELFDWSEAPRNLFVAATYTLIFGAVFSLPTALTGFWDWLKSTPKHTQAWRTANWHMAVMLTLTALVVVNILMRLGDFDETGATGLGLMIFTAVIGFLVSFGSAYGGSLVYDYGFNVEQGNDHVWETSETDKMPGEGLTE